MAPAVHTAVGDRDEQSSPLLRRGARRAADCAPVRRNAARVSCWSLCVLLPAAALAAAFAAADRPALLLRQLLSPVQWAMVGGYTQQGYTVVPIPESVRQRLADLVDGQPDGDVRFGGADGRVEDSIIFGPTSRLYLPEPLLSDLREAMRPLVAAFCGCELAEHATVGSGAVRIYKRGASLAHHLDWAHLFVVSATLNVRQRNRSSRWPLTLHGLGGAAHEVEHAEGEAVLYEGSRMLHARPRPLGDDFYAAAFVGFVPRRYPEGRGPLTRAWVGAVRCSAVGWRACWDAWRGA